MENFTDISDTLGIKFTTKIEKTVCDKHNIETEIVKYITAEHTSVVTKCPECRKDKENQKKLEMLELHRRTVAEQKQRLIEKMTKNAKINISYAHADFSTFDVSKQPKIYPLYLDYANNIDDNIKQGKNIFARGTTGRGKTHLAVALAKVALFCGYTVLFETMTAIQLALEDRAKPVIETLKLYFDVDLLIIDELVPIPYPKTRMLIDEILEYRYNHKKPIIINTHLPIANITEILDETRRSRLKENCLVSPFVDFDIFYAEQDKVSKIKYDYRNERGH